MHFPCITILPKIYLSYLILNSVFKALVFSSFLESKRNEAELRKELNRTTADNLGVRTIAGVKRAHTIITSFCEIFACVIMGMKQVNIISELNVES